MVSRREIELKIEIRDGWNQGDVLADIVRMMAYYNKVGFQLLVKRVEEAPKVEREA